MLSLALGCTIGVASLSAHDDQPPAAVVASLPDEGQPPAPSIDAAATIETVNATAKVEPVPSAEVVTSEQVEQLADKPAEQVAAQPAPPAEVRELSIEPVLEKRPMLPADRPAWVGAPNDTSERIHRLYVASFTAKTAAEVEADEMLDEPIVAAVQRYLNETLFPNDESLPLPVTAEFVRHNLLDKSTSYVAAMTTQSGTEYQKWVVLQVTPEHREYFTQLLREHKQRHRLAALGTGLAGLLGVTALLNFGFNRRRRRYPNSLAPVAMAMMPGQGPAMGLGNGHDNQVQYVAAGATPVAACKVTRKKRSCVRKTLLAMVGAGLVFALVAPAVTLVKLEPHRAVRTEHVRVDVDGNKVYEHTKILPFTEEASSDHH